MHVEWILLTIISTLSHPTPPSSPAAAAAAAPNAPHSCLPALYCDTFCLNRTISTAVLETTHWKLWFYPWVQNWWHTSLFLRISVLIVQEDCGPAGLSDSNDWLITCSVLCRSRSGNFSFCESHYCKDRVMPRKWYFTALFLIIRLLYSS